MREQLVEQLSAVGLSQNEALAYLTLLEDGGDGGLTGYEVAARSGIPRSAVYNVLRKLEGAGAAFPVGAEPARYLPQPPQRLLERFRAEQADRLGQLEGSLAALPPRATPEPIWVLRRYDEVMGRISALIRGAERRLYLSLWQRELALVLPALVEVAPRLEHAVLHCPDELSPISAPLRCWSDDLAGDLGKATWAHRALVVVDQREALIGGAEPDADNQAICTRNPSLVDVATNHIILDITLLARRQGLDPAETVDPMLRPQLKA